MQRLIAQRLLRGGASGVAADTVTLDYEDRFLRRRTLATEGGASLLVDLPETVSLDEGDALVLQDGRRVAVASAREPLIEVRGDATALARFAWHIGNRHMPAQIEPDRVLIQANHVMADMLARLGAATRDVRETFTPERGAYGVGRTHGHHHGGAGDDPHPAEPA